MVLAYLCPEHGWHDECDVAVGGERTCIEGADTAVTGITGSTRAPDRREGNTSMMSGDIRWSVKLGYGDHWTGFVDAFDYEEALDKAVEKYGHTEESDHTITAIRPRDRDKRNSP